MKKYVEHISVNTIRATTQIKDIHREKSPSNKTPTLTESTHMGIRAVGTTNQLFVRGSYTETKFSKK